MDDYLKKTIIALNEEGINDISQLTIKGKVTFKYNDPVCIDFICLEISNDYTVISEVFGDESFTDFESALTVFINLIKVSRQINIDNILFI